jgi:hypothetical protein
MQPDHQLLSPLLALVWPSHGNRLSPLTNNSNKDIPPLVIAFVVDCLPNSHDGVTRKSNALAVQKARLGVSENSGKAESHGHGQY